MKGARHYAQLFETGQYGRLYITSGSHARGLTFRIQVLPQGEQAKGNGRNNLCLNPDAVEVYGIISGNPGWTEEYGWKYRGPWIEDFQDLVVKQKRKLRTVDIASEEKKQSCLEEEARRVAALLASY